MDPLVDIVRRSRRSFVGSMAWGFARVIAVASFTGATAGVLPAVIGRAVAVVTSAAEPSGGAPGVFSKVVTVAMPAGGTWAAVLITLVATIVAVGLGVLSSRMGTSLSGDVTAAMRIEMMRAVLGASTRDVEELGSDLAAAGKPRAGPAPAGKAPPGRVLPGKAPPGKALPGMPAAVKGGPPGAPPAKVPPAKEAAAGAPHGATREAIVRLAVSREAATVSDFAVSVSAALPQSLVTLLVLTIELVASGAWVVLAGGLGLFFTSRLLADRASARVGEARLELNNADAAVFGRLGETLAASEDLRLWGAREQAVSEFAQLAQQVAEARARFATALAVAGQVKAVFSAMAPLLIVVALKLSGEAYGPGDVAKLLLLVPLLMSRAEALDAIRQGRIERGPLVRAALKVLDLAPAPPRVADPVRLEMDDVEGHIRFEDVCFTPPGADRALIDGVSLDIPAGATVGICGPSGSGKSTLLRLLLRLDDPDAGRVTMDGHDLREIDPDLLPQLFGVVRQTSQLLERPVRDNLGVGLDPCPEDDAMKEALAAVKLDELAATGGAADARDLGTPYRKNPPNFSGGECRRLLLARMLLSGARVHVLDEPEAGLPSGTAEQILETIVEIAPGKTHVVVTHAPHLLRSNFNCVLDRGKLVATGTHAELEKSCQVYRDLLAESLKSAEETA